MKKNPFITFWKGDAGLGPSFWFFYVILTVVILGIFLSIDNINELISRAVMASWFFYTIVGLYRSLIKTKPHIFIKILVYMALISRAIKVFLIIFFAFF